MIHWPTLLLGVFLVGGISGQYSGHVCTIERTSAPGICKLIYECSDVISQIERRRSYTRCGFEGRNEFVCCPDDTIKSTPSPTTVIYRDSTNNQRSQVCTIERTSSQGICKIVYECPAVISQIEKRRRYTRCGFEGRNEIVCCPDETIKPTQRPTAVINRDSSISQRKCKEYSEAVFEYVYSISLAVESQSMKIKVDKCGHKSVPLIVGGEYAKPKEFPHMALIGFDLGNKQVSWSCGGTLISDQYVLTAAHCLRTQSLGNPKYIRLGELDLLSETDDAKPETFNIVEIIGHPEYKGNSKYNDIGLLKMDKKVKLNPYIRPACLPTTFEGPEKEAIATGWGHTEWAGKGSNHMLKVTLTKFGNQECNSTYASLINRRLRDGIRERTQICAGSRTASKDTCQGDSGGPLQVYNQDLYCMYSVIGITSFGITCGNINVPGVYTRVHPYVNWIESIVWKDS